MKRELLELLYKFTEADKDVVDRLRQMSLSENKRIINTISNNNSQYFHVPNYVNYSPYLVEKNIEKIGCLLPKKLIVATAMDYTSITRVLRFRPFLDNDIFELFLFESEDSNNDEHHEMRIINNQLTSSNVELLTQSIDSLSYKSYIEVILPWLEGARPKDYISIMTKYKLQYDIYCNHIDKLAHSAANPESLTHLLVQETKDAFIEMRITLEKSKAELKKVGINTMIGSVLTSIPLLIPDSGSSISPELLSGLLGATNIFATIPPLTSSIKEIRTGNRFNPYWLLWKWSKS